jgi:hypothetical protein
MLETTSRLAEQVANSLSRRGFLGSLGSWAAAAALGVSGVLSGRSASAHAKQCAGKCCAYICGPVLRVDKKCNQCPPSQNGCALLYCADNHAVSEGCLC